MPIPVSMPPPNCTGDASALAACLARGDDCWTAMQYRVAEACPHYQSWSPGNLGRAIPRWRLLEQFLEPLQGRHPGEGTAQLDALYWTAELYDAMADTVPRVELNSTQRRQFFASALRMVPRLQIVAPAPSPIRGAFLNSARQMRVFLRQQARQNQSDSRALRPPPAPPPMFVALANTFMVARILELAEQQEKATALTSSASPPSTSPFVLIDVRAALEFLVRSARTSAGVYGAPGGGAQSSSMSLVLAGTRAFQLLSERAPVDCPDDLLVPANPVQTYAFVARCYVVDADDADVAGFCASPPEQRRGASAAVQSPATMPLQTPSLLATYDAWRILVATGSWDRFVSQFPRAPAQLMAFLGQHQHFATKAYSMTRQRKPVSRHTHQPDVVSTHAAVALQTFLLSDASSYEPYPAGKALFSSGKWRVGLAETSRGPCPFFFSSEHNASQWAPPSASGRYELALAQFVLDLQAGGAGAHVGAGGWRMAAGDTVAHLEPTVAALRLLVKLGCVGESRSLLGEAVAVVGSFGDEWPTAEFLSGACIVNWTVLVLVLVVVGLCLARPSVTEYASAEQCTVDEFWLMDMMAVGEPLLLVDRHRKSGALVCPWTGSALSRTELLDSGEYRVQSPQTVNAMAMAAAHQVEAAYPGGVSVASDMAEINVLQTEIAIAAGRPAAAPAVSAWQRLWQWKWLRPPEEHQLGASLAQNLPHSSITMTSPVNADSPVSSTSSSPVTSLRGSSAGDRSELLWSSSSLLSQSSTSSVGPPSPDLFGDRNHEHHRDHRDGVGFDHDDFDEPGRDGLPGEALAAASAALASLQAILTFQLALVRGPRDPDQYERLAFRFHGPARPSPSV